MDEQIAPRSRRARRLGAGQHRFFRVLAGEATEGILLRRGGLGPAEAQQSRVTLRRPQPPSLCAGPLSVPKIPSAGDLATRLSLLCGQHSLLASENSLFGCVGNLGVTS